MYKCYEFYYQIEFMDFSNQNILMRAKTSQNLVLMILFFNVFSSLYKNKNAVYCSKQSTFVLILKMSFVWMSFKNEKNDSTIAHCLNIWIYLWPIQLKLNFCFVHKYKMLICTNNTNKYDLKCFLWRLRPSFVLSCT